MFDVKIVSIRDILRVSSVSFVPNFTPRSLFIDGERMHDATSVLINDVEAPQFVILSGSRLMVQVPTSQANSVITKIVVLAGNPSKTRNNLIEFDTGRMLSKIKGIEKLVQQFVKILLQTPGSDRFNPELGGGLLGFVGMVDDRTGTAVTGGVVSAVSAARDQLVKLQSGNSSIPADEKLLTVNVLAAGYDAHTTTLSMNLQIQSLAGQQATTNLTF